MAVAEMFMMAAILTFRFGVKGNERAVMEMLDHGRVRKWITDEERKTSCGLSFGCAYTRVLTDVADTSLGRTNRNQMRTKCQKASLLDAFLHVKCISKTWNLGKNSTTYGLKSRDNRLSDFAK